MNSKKIRKLNETIDNIAKDLKEAYDYIEELSEKQRWIPVTESRRQQQAKIDWVFQMRKNMVCFSECAV